MIDCTEHRAYLGAIADGETQLVPPATLAHLDICPGCRREVSAHSLLNEKLRSAVDGRLPGDLPYRLLRRSWVRTASAAVAVLVLLAGGITTWRSVSGEDRVAAAAAVAGQAPQFRSNDSSEIGAWCQNASGRSMPDIQLDSLQPIGARMDHRAGSDIVSVQYWTAQGDQVDVAWLDGARAAPDRATIAARSLGGHLVLLVTSPGGTAVVSGSAPANVLWMAAASIERADAGARAGAPAA